MKKLLYTIGSMAALAAPIVGAVSCGPKGPVKEKVMLVTDGGKVTDKSFNEQAFEALGEILERKPKTTDYISPAKADVATIMNGYKSAVKAKTTIILAPGFHHVDPINKFNKEVGTKTKFILVDSVIDSPNVASVVFKTKLSGFQAGYLAASYENFSGNKNATHKVGTFGGGAFPGVTDFMVGFIEGVKYYNSTLSKENKVAKSVHFVKFATDEQYTNTTFTPGKGLANSAFLIQNGADVILPVAGPQTADAIKAITDAKSKSLVIGVDTDQKILYPKDKNMFLTSIKKNVKKAMVDVYNKGTGKECVTDPNIKGFGKTTIGNLKNGLTSITTDDQASLTELYAKATSAKVNAEALKIDNVTWAQALKDLKAL